MKAKTILVVVAAVVVYSFFTSCSDLIKKLGPPIKPSATTLMKNYKFENIRGITVTEGIVVHCSSQTPQGKVQVKGPQNVVKEVEIKVRVDGILEIGMPVYERIQYTSDSQRPEVWMSSADLFSFEAINGAAIEVTDTLKGNEELYAASYSGGKIQFAAIRTSPIRIETFQKAEITASDIKTELLLAGAYTQSSITVSGTTMFLDLTAVSGAIDASGLSARSGHAYAMYGGLIHSDIQHAEIIRHEGGEVTNKGEDSEQAEPMKQTE